MKVAAICLLCCLQASGQTPALEGTGRTCWGHLWHNHKTLDWQSSFLKCKSTYTVESHDEAHTVLKVKQDAACHFSRIEAIKPEDQRRAGCIHNCELVMPKQRQVTGGFNDQV